MKRLLYVLPAAMLILFGSYMLEGRYYELNLNANGRTSDSLDLSDTCSTVWWQYPGPWPATGIYVVLTSTAADTVHVHARRFHGRGTSLDSGRAPLRIYQPSRSSSDDSIAICQAIPGSSLYQARFRVYEMYVGEPISLSRGFPYDYKPSKEWRYDIYAYDQGATQ